VTAETVFLCPFCSDRPVRCTCADPYKYDEPIIQCTRCKFWMHKSCAGFTFGPNPSGFRCWNCEPGQYHIPPFGFAEHSKCLDTVASPALDRGAFLARLPEGDLREKFAETLEAAEFPFRAVICSFLDEFAPCLFEYTRDFWKTFVSALAELLVCEKSDVLAAIDELIVSHWYLPPAELALEPIPGLVVGDAITPNVESEPLPALDRFPPDVPLAFRDDRVIVEREVAHGGFICDIPGLLCHEDEIDASLGIPRSCINIAGTQIVIDVSRSTNQLIQRIKRSFHYNCLAKIVRVAGEVRVGLYATGMKGPMLEDKSTRGIAQNSELLLSMDADLPYAVERPFWKLKRAKSAGKSRRTRAPKPREIPEARPRPKKKEIPEIEPRTMKTRAKTEFPFSLTLLSAFCEDACPPMMLVLRDDKKMRDEAPESGTFRTRLRTMRTRQEGDS
jgi:hypothetical protein